MIAYSNVSLIAAQMQEIANLREQIKALEAENGQLNTIIHHAKQMEELDTSERDELKRQLAEYKADAELKGGASAPSALSAVLGAGG